MRVIIVGAGEVGFNVARRLSGENKDVVVIDKNSKALTRVSETLDVQTILGSGSNPEILEQAGVQEADIFLAVTDKDEINLISTFLANRIAPKIIKLARIRNEDYTKYPEMFTEGDLRIDTLINPDEEVVESILRVMSVPGAVEINDFVGGKVRLIGVKLPKESPLTGVTLMNIKEHLGGVDVVIAALVREDRLIIPGGLDTIEEGDIVYFACVRDQQDKLLKLAGILSDPIRKVLIVGGGNVGLLLAQALDNKKFHTRLLDRDPERCAELSENLDRIIVLHGDGTDQDLLKEENVGDLDMVISVTGDEEMNILSCLLAKNLGARKTITRISNFAYIPLIEPIGIDHLVCPRLSAINSILHFVRQGKVISAVSIKGEEAEALEAIAQENSGIVGKPIMDLHLPKGTLILCFQRGEEVIIPTGLTVIEPNDRLLIISTRKNISAIEDALTTKLEYY
ncbi:Trk system potassium transporter TrkA [Maridesulfovibrio frigidus]|uniref:Trk system potassium transporter TrkA n=1 Tax=Maridesulfovibrio frigidus TaxID=340956 RepID=UPI0004E15AE2|nr:Trk system potassium transporter TrkA [Maridesulfovibrio frigidus]